MNSVVYRRKLPRFEYLEAKTVEEAISLLSRYEGKVKVIAGGTDLLNAMKRRKKTPQYLIDIKSIPNLDYIHYTGDGLKIGALATLADIESSNIIQEKCPMLAATAKEMAQPQIRNVATIGGNLCNAAPSADTASPLIALGASVKIEGSNGARVCALEDFFVGPGKCVFQAGEILTEIQVPNLPPHTAAVYLKLPARTVVDIAVAGVAAVLTLNPQHTKIADARIVLCAVAPTPLRAHKAEDIIKGKAIKDELIEKAAQAAAEEAKPISDVRGSAAYRKEMVTVLTRRVIKQVLGLLQ